MQNHLNRRSVLGSVASGLAGAGLTACGGSVAAETKKPAFVLVHGSWHNASTYTLVIQQLAQLGHFAVALDLPGHGLDARFPVSWHQRPFNAAAFATEVSPVAATTLADYSARTIAVIDQVRALGYEKVMLVGHSMGGVTITQVGEMVPNKVQKLVYLAAFLPANGASGLAAALLPEGATNQVPPLWLADPAAIGAMRIDFDSPDSAYRAKVKQAFYADVSDDAFSAMGNMLVPDDAAGPTATPITRTAANWGSLERHYIKCLQDNAMPQPLAQKMVDVADQEFPSRKTVMHTMNSSHSPFLSQPQALAQMLASISLS
jgi:pimeloyl-ACP methyl ester carboxylesterase